MPCDPGDFVSRVGLGGAKMTKMAAREEMSPWARRAMLLALAVSVTVACSTGPGSGAPAAAVKVRDDSVTLADGAEASALVSANPDISRCLGPGAECVPSYGQTPCCANELCDVI